MFVDFCRSVKVADSFMLILEPSSLYLGIDVFSGNQIIECHKVDGEVYVLSSDIGIPVPIGMVNITVDGSIAICSPEPPTRIIQEIIICS